jgi:hypothetical protein
MPIRSSAASSTKGAPGVPTIGTATAADGSASVTFSAPSFSKLPITGYTVTASPGGATGTGSSSPITVSGLTNGTSYTFTVRATSAGGTSAASSASNSATPAAPFFALSVGNGTGGIGGRTVPVGQGADSNGNLYAVGLAADSNDSYKQVYVCKTDSSGSVLLNTKVNSTYTNFSPTVNTQFNEARSCTDADGNTYIARTYQDSSSTVSVSVMKIASDGSMPWHNSYLIYGGTFAFFGSVQIASIGVSSNGTLYVLPSSGGYGPMAVLVINASSGNKINVFGYDSGPQGEGEGESAPYPNLTAIAVESASGIYAVGTERSIYGQYAGMYVAKLTISNSSISAIWEKSYTLGGNNVGFPTDIAVSGDKVYALSSGSNAAMYLTAINVSSGALEWQKSYTTGNENNGSIAVAPNGNVTIVGNSNVDSYIHLYSYNSSGTLLWNAMYVPSSSDGDTTYYGGYYISATNNYIYVSTYAAGVNWHLKLKADGSTATFTKGGITFTRYTNNTPSDTTSSSSTSSMSIPWTEISALGWDSDKNANVSASVETSTLTTNSYSL